MSASTASTSTPFTLVSTVLGTPDPHTLALFYQRLLGWSIGTDEPDWVTLRPADGGPGLSFQLETEHVPPVWPAGASDQQMQLHLDLLVGSLPAGVEQALAAGARLAESQPQGDVRVLLDPDGHPFCLFES
jgi:catechol 2,3-dioxygenase-like lactoylglutathione lyase family enzyme